MPDYVIIGGGSSGGVIASRLSEDPETTVCLLEAGGSGNSPLVSTPGAFAALIQDFAINTLNWRYNTEPNPALNGRRLYNPRGKMLGGSSGMNGMVYIRGDRSDFDTWRDLGNQGWRPAVSARSVRSTPTATMPKARSSRRCTMR